MRKLRSILVFSLLLPLLFSGCRFKLAEPSDTASEPAATSGASTASGSQHGSQQGSQQPGVDISGGIAGDDRIPLSTYVSDPGIYAGIGKENFSECGVELVDAADEYELCDEENRDLLSGKLSAYLELLCQSDRLVLPNAYQYDFNEGFLVFSACSVKCCYPQQSFEDYVESVKLAVAGMTFCSLEYCQERYGSNASSYYSENKAQWVAQRGEYEFRMAISHDDNSITVSLDNTENWTAEVIAANSRTFDTTVRVADTLALPETYEYIVDSGSGSRSILARSANGALYCSLLVAEDGSVLLSDSSSPSCFSRSGENWIRYSVVSMSAGSWSGGYKIEAGAIDTDCGFSFSQTSYDTLSSWVRFCADFTKTGAKPNVLKIAEEEVSGVLCDVYRYSSWGTDTTYWVEPDTFVTFKKTTVSGGETTVNFEVAGYSSSPSWNYGLALPQEVSK